MRKIGIGLTAALFIAAVAAPAIASKPSDGTSGLDESGHKVTICHATSSDTNPWLVITVDIASSGGRNKLMGHLEHANDPNKQGGRGDVIPPFTYPGFEEFPGAGDPNQPGLPIACGGAATATLTLTKAVVNLSGDATADDFQATVDGTNVGWSVPIQLTPGQKVAAEVPDPGFEGYEASVWGGDCSPDGSITLIAGDNKTCSITNTEQQSS